MSEHLLLNILLALWKRNIIINIINNATINVSSNIGFFYPILLLLEFLRWGRMRGVKWQEGLYVFWYLKMVCSQSKVIR